jgi:hypothetical protein
LQDRHVGEQVEVLKHHANLAQRFMSGWRWFSEVGIQGADNPAICDFKAADAANQGRFS